MGIFGGLGSIGGGILGGVGGLLASGGNPAGAWAGAQLGMNLGSKIDSSVNKNQAQKDAKKKLQQRAAYFRGLASPLEQSIVPALTDPSGAFRNSLLSQYTMPQAQQIADEEEALRNTGWLNRGGREGADRRTLQAALVNNMALGGAQASDAAQRYLRTMWQTKLAEKAGAPVSIGENPWQPFLAATGNFTDKTLAAAAPGGTY